MCLVCVLKQQLYHARGPHARAPLPPYMPACPTRMSPPSSSATESPAPLLSLPTTAVALTRPSRSRPTASRDTTDTTDTSETVCR